MKDNVDKIYMTDIGIVYVLIYNKKYTLIAEKENANLLIRGSKRRAFEILKKYNYNKFRL